MYVPHSVPEKSKLNISENWADYTKIKYYRLWEKNALDILGYKSVWELQSTGIST